MKEKEKILNEYYNKTKFNQPRKNVQYFIEKVKSKPSKAIELGCGAGNETIYLIKHNWDVTAIDKEDVEEQILNRLSKEEIKKFTFKRQRLENIELEKNELVVANYSLPFCNKEKFKECWNKINESILENGYFVGNFFGKNDSWCKIKPMMTFLTKEEVLELFKDFKIIKFDEIERDGMTALGKNKHWHIYGIIAKKTHHLT